MIVKSLNRLEHMPKMGFTQKDQTVEALANFANMPFGECVALPRPRRRSDHLDPVGANDGIEGHEHGIAVVNEIAARQPRFAEEHGKIARLLRGPIAIGMRRATCDEDAPRAQVNEEQNVERDQTAQRPDLLGEKIGRPSGIEVRLNELLPGDSFAVRGCWQSIRAKHISNITRRHDVTELVELPSDAFVTPGAVFLRQFDHQFICLGILARTTDSLRPGVEAPFRLFHRTIPGKQRFRRGNGGDLPEPILQLEAEAQENSAVGISQRNASAELAPQDLILLAQIVVFESEIPIEECPNPGDCGSGESEIRRWILENDWLDAIVMLPGELFYNTGIFTYIWLLRNDKPASHRGRVMLIDARQQFEKEPKAFSYKRNRMTDAHRAWVEERYFDGWAKNYSDEQVKIFRREDFAYHKVSVVFWQTDENDQPAIITEPYEKAFSGANIVKELEFYSSDLTFRARVKAGGKEKTVELALTAKDNAARNFKAAFADADEILSVEWTHRHYVADDEYIPFGEDIEAFLKREIAKPIIRW